MIHQMESCAAAAADKSGNVRAVSVAVIRRIFTRKIFAINDAILSG